MEDCVQPTWRNLSNQKWCVHVAICVLFILFLCDTFHSFSIFFNRNRKFRCLKKTKQKRLEVLVRVKGAPCWSIGELHPILFILSDAFIEICCVSSQQKIDYSDFCQTASYCFCVRCKLMCWFLISQVCSLLAGTCSVLISHSSLPSLQWLPLIHWCTSLLPQIISERPWWEERRPIRAPGRRFLGQRNQLYHEQCKAFLCIQQAKLVK